MEWKPGQTSNEGAKVPESWIFLHYYDALNVLFRIENALRVLVFLVLKRHYRGKWQEIGLSSDDQNNTTIGALAKRRLAQDQAFGYLGYPITSPLMHLTSGELVGLITSESYWKHFKEYFIAAKNVVTLKLQEIGNVRNSLAHFRPVSAGDVEVVKQNARQVLTKAEETIGQLAGITNKIPSNTDDSWYRALVTVGNDLASLGFTQSVDEQWVRISLSYKYPKIGNGYGSETRKDFKVLNLITPAILGLFPSISGNISFLSEAAGFSYARKDPEAVAKKRIGLVFHRQVISENFAEVKEGLEDLLRLIANETELIQQDNLARGKIVASADVHAVREEGNEFWKANLSRLLCPVTPESAPEYWGDFSFRVVDFVSDTESFPWMPVTISAEDDIPF